MMIRRFLRHSFLARNATNIENAHRWLRFRFAILRQHAYMYYGEMILGRC